MSSAYLYLNALLYLLFAVWCTVAPAKTSASLGYQSLSAGGHSEYLVLYGGLQLGLAIGFFLAARNPEWTRAGIAFSLALYAPIVLFRLVTVIRYWPVATLTIATGVLEALLLLGAIWLYLSRG